MQNQILIGAFFLMPLFFCFGLPIMMARLSGWSKLAKRFKAAQDPEGDFYPKQSIKVNNAAYQRSIDIFISPRGLYLEPGFWLRLSHDPLFFSWEEVVSVDREDYLEPFFTNW